jgi:aspartate racemase
MEKMNRMKRIGLIGGMSWESTIPYYRIINEEVNSKLGGLNSADIVLYSLNFSEMEKHQSKNDWEKVGEIIINAAKILENSKCDFILICTNTIHKIYDKIQKEIKVPIIHIAEATASELIKNRTNKILLLGTKYTMKEDFIKNILINNNIKVFIPEENDIITINNIIFNELCLGIFNKDSKNILINIINDFEKKCDGVILGCTELGLLIEQKDINIKLFDTTVIHAKKAAELALN